MNWRDSVVVPSYKWKGKIHYKVLYLRDILNFSGVILIALVLFAFSYGFQPITRLRSILSSKEKGK